MHAAVGARGWATRTIVGNDTFAVLRAGTERGWGVAVVCGAGINCVGVAPDGRHARFPALGAITGDWGGGYDVGLAAVSAAARSEDGRGPKTASSRPCRRTSGSRRRSSWRRRSTAAGSRSGGSCELAPLVFAEAERRRGRGRDRRAARRRGRRPRPGRARRGSSSTDEPVEVLLGGGLLQAGDGDCSSAIEAGLREVGPRSPCAPTASPPIVGAALLGLDELGADAAGAGARCDASSTTRSPRSSGEAADG